MTQEQNKPVRSRDEQVEDLTSLFGEEGTFTFVDDRDAATKHILEAEARGAAEQRRKDAEDCAPRYQVWNNNPGFWDDCPEDEEDWRWEHATEADRRILYTRPANVAALEARIAELEGALTKSANALEQVTDGERGGYKSRNGKFVSLQMSDGERADIIHSDVTTECEGALETARASLTREGGV